MGSKQKPFCVAHRGSLSVPPMQRIRKHVGRAGNPNMLRYCRSSGSSVSAAAASCSPRSARRTTGAGRPLDNSARPTTKHQVSGLGRRALSAVRVLLIYAGDERRALAPVRLPVVPGGWRPATLAGCRAATTGRRQWAASAVAGASATCGSGHHPQRPLRSSERPSRGARVSRPVPPPAPRPRSVAARGSPRPGTGPRSARPWLVPAGG